MKEERVLEIQKQAEQYLVNSKYAEAIAYYEGAIESEPENKYYYLYLGLMSLLQGQEEEAQMTWLLAMSEGEPEQIDIWNAELIHILDREASRQAKLENYQTAWAIRQYIRELNSTDINNLLRLVYLSIEIQTYTAETLAESGIIDLLKEGSFTSDLDQNLLLGTWDRVLKAAAMEESSLEFTKAIVPHVRQPERFIKILLDLAYELAYAGHQHSRAIEFCKVGLQVTPNNPKLLDALASFCTDTGDYGDAIEYAQLAYAIAETATEQLYRNLVVIKSMMSAGGYWEQLAPFIDRQKGLIGDAIAENPEDLGTSELLINLYSASFYFPYLQDNPRENITLRKEIHQLCQRNVEIACGDRVENYRQKNAVNKTAISSKKRLKIGYISSCFRRHSVGWLARSLFEHRDRDKFEIYTYMVASRILYDPVKEWYNSRSDKVHQYGLVTLEVADRISADEIDILVDLDSLTANTICGIMALKPAPIQVTWLGWDASAIPTIDYFIADPYVLPEDAQDYYPETIWRLPQTYLAVDGFEVSVPTITRADLDIPDDAVVYLGAQRGPKYNPHIAKLQMKILKEVPDSYFIIKGFGEQTSLNRFFFEIAEEEGISRDRIKFISKVKLEEIHRANLQIADVVLDTYPYNGATTTMETLWMCIPMVTRVGQQFAARNSYTMMRNAGLAEGIARTDEEYIEWGIRLGKDESLRQQVYWKLRNSRQTAPLWNGKQFTREMEKAYEGMWRRYIEGGS